MARLRKDDNLRPLGTMASLGHTRAVARVFGFRLTGFVAWWMRRTYYLFQMPRWGRRLRIVLDWTVALFFRPDITKVELRVEREHVRRTRDMTTAAGKSAEHQPKSPLRRLDTSANSFTCVCNHQASG
jgi:hypothetical protein